MMGNLQFCSLFYFIWGGSFVASWVWDIWMVSFVDFRGEDDGGVATATMEEGFLDFKFESKLTL